MMSVRTRRLSWMLWGFSALGCAAQAAPSIEIRTAWVRVPAPGVAATAGYFTLFNRSATDDTLLAASSPVASDVQMHVTFTTGGVARMRPMSHIVVPAGDTVSFAPGGPHLMFMGLSTSLAAGSSVPVTLVFERAGEITARFAVRSGP